MKLIISVVVVYVIGFIVSMLLLKYSKKFKEIFGYKSVPAQCWGEPDDFVESYSMAFAWPLPIILIGFILLIGLCLYPFRKFFQWIFRDQLTET